MMDPITLLATASAAFNGVKKAVSLGREVQDIYKQLSKWADAADQLYSVISKNLDKSPGLFETISFKKSATAEALDLAAAKVQLQQMEEEIKTMFFYGELQVLGANGYREFLDNRRLIREKRDRMIRQQAKRRAQFVENCFWIISLVIVISFGIYGGIVFYQHGLDTGKW